MSDRLWLLGAADPEMERIEHLLKQTGEKFEYAMISGIRVNPSTAYMLRNIPDEVTHLVECGTPETGLLTRIVIDHHRPGDKGFNRSYREFLEASSIGQVISELAKLKKLNKLDWGVTFKDSMDDAIGNFRHSNEDDSWLCAVDAHEYEEGGEVFWMQTYRMIPYEYVLAAASDHCPTQAYKGICTGVEPNEVMRFRAENKAKFLRITAQQYIHRVERAMFYIKRARTMNGIADLRFGAPPDLQEVPEASLRLGIPIMNTFMDKDGRQKFNCLGGDKEQIAWFKEFLHQKGYTDIYGDEERGYAGGYIQISLS
jgi:hypothetical protein